MSETQRIHEDTEKKNTVGERVARQSVLMERFREVFGADFFKIKTDIVFDVKAIPYVALPNFPGSVDMTAHPGREELVTILNHDLDALLALDIPLPETEADFFGEPQVRAASSSESFHPTKSEQVSANELLREAQEHLREFFVLSRIDGCGCRKYCQTFSSIDSIC